MCLAAGYLYDVDDMEPPPRADDLPEQRRDDKENIQQGNIPERPDDTIIHSKGFSSSQTRYAPKCVCKLRLV
jgi:hypothetical protein